MHDCFTPLVSSLMILSVLVALFSPTKSQETIGLFIYLFVISMQDISKSRKWIGMKFLG